MSRHHSPHIVTDGLVLYLDAANPKSYVSGSTTWYDLSKNSNIGTLINGTTFNSGNGGSIVFDGVNDGVDLLNLESYSNTSPHTYSAWIYPTSLTTIRWIINNGSANVGHAGTNLALWYDKVGFLYSAGENVVNSTIILTPNTWYNVSTVYGGNRKVDFYVNGLFDIRRDVGVWIAGNTNPRIGKWYTESYSFLGMINSVQIYNRALTAQEVKQNFDALKSRFGL